MLRPRPSRPSRTCTCRALQAAPAWWLSYDEPSRLLFRGVFVGYGYFNSPACGSLPDAGDVRGADTVAVRDRSEPLHRRSQQPAERLGFGLAQLRELRRHVRDRAVVLAELFAGFGPRAADGGRRAGRCGVAVGGQCLRPRLDPAGPVAAG